MKKVLDTDLIRIFDAEDSYQVYITAQSGAVIEHEPFPRDQRGLVAALMLATDVLAGKVWLKNVCVVHRDKLNPPERVQLESGF